MVVRILQVVTYMGRGGLETMLMNYYRNIDRNKIQFDFLTHRDFRADYDDEIESLGGKIYHLPLLNPLSREYKKKLNQFFDTHPEYRVVHVHQDCMSSVILKAAAQHKVPVRIAHSHNASQDRNLKYPIKLFYRRFIPQYATDLMACGEDAGKWMFRGAKYQVLNNAINAREYAFDAVKRVVQRAMLGVGDDELLIGHVGRFSPTKNHAFLIDIFQVIQDKIPAKLLLVGDGVLRKDIEKKVKQLNLTDKVIFTGVRSDVPDLMQAMDVFIFPSNYEGLPVTMIEAQAAGLPCLISDNVPIECKKTDLIQQISLSAPTSVWAGEVLRAVQKERKNTYEAINKAGFDIVENAGRLQQFYISAAAGEKNLCL